MLNSIFLLQKLKKFASQGYLTLDIIRNILIIAIFLLIIYLTAATLYSKDISFNTIQLPNIEESKEKFILQKEKKDFSDFLNKIRDKDIFGAQKEVIVEVDVDPQKVSEIIKTFKLVGVIVGDSVKAIIENTAQGKSYYVQEGQVVEDELILKKIKKDSVTLDYNGKKIDLYI